MIPVTTHRFASCKMSHVKYMFMQPETMLTEQLGRALYETRQKARPVCLSGSGTVTVQEEAGERLGYILSSIETLVLPVSPATAFELLVLLIERDGDAMEQCGDDDCSVQLKLETAARLVATAVKSLPSREARQTLERLVAEDGYGSRAPLTDVLANLSL
jgi:hypothetical protein